MGKESTHNSMISGALWRLVFWLSSALTQADRDAVLGDLLEHGEGGTGALRNVLGLLARKQAAVLKDWRLWAVLGFLILPASFLLSLSSRTEAGVGAVYTWMYVNNWDWELTKSPGFWQVLREAAMQFGLSCVVLACESWSIGFVLGRLPKAILRTCQILFALLLTISQIADAPHLFIVLWAHLRGVPLPSLPDLNAPVNAIVLYRALFPWIILVSLVILPANFGIQEGQRASNLSGKWRIVLLTAASSQLLITILLPGLGLFLGTSGRNWIWNHRNVMQMLSTLGCWPAIYLVVVNVVRYRSPKAVPA